MPDRQATTDCFLERKMLKKIFIILSVLFISNAVIAKNVYVKPHITKNGTFVSGHYRSKPNKTKLDNYSTKGNFNPYTFKDGTASSYSYKKHKKRH